MIPGTIGSANSLVEESHSEILLEHPHYTRPVEYRNIKVPEVLRSGNHAAISRWRQTQREIRTKERRPELYKQWILKQKS